MYWSVNELSLWSLLFLIPRPVSGQASWLSSIQFTRQYAMYQLTWANKSAMSYGALITYFIGRSMSAFHDDTVKVKNFKRRFTCSDDSLATLVAREGVIEDLKTIRHKEPVKLAKLGAHTFNLRAKLTVVPLTVTYNYTLQVKSKGGDTAEYNGTVWYSINENNVTLDIMFTIDTKCSAVINRPLLSVSTGYKFNITGLKGTAYKNDLKEQCSLHFMMYIKNQIEVYYHSLFKKTEMHGVMSTIIYSAFNAYFSRNTVHQNRNIFHPKSRLRPIYLNRKKGYNLDKYGINIGEVKGPKHFVRKSNISKNLAGRSQLVRTPDSLEELESHARSLQSSTSLEEQQSRSRSIKTISSETLKSCHRSPLPSPGLLEDQDQQTHSQTVQLSFSSEQQTDRPLLVESSMDLKDRIRRLRSSVQSCSSSDGVQSSSESLIHSSSLEEPQKFSRSVQSSRSSEEQQSLQQSESLSTSSKEPQRPFSRLEQNLVRKQELRSQSLPSSLEGLQKRARSLQSSSSSEELQRLQPSDSLSTYSKEPQKPFSQLEQTLVRKQELRSESLPSSLEGLQKLSRLVQSSRSSEELQRLQQSDSLSTYSKEPEKPFSQLEQNRLRKQEQRCNKYNLLPFMKKINSIHRSDIESDSLA